MKELFCILFGHEFDVERSNLPAFDQPDRGYALIQCSRCLGFHLLKNFRIYKEAGEVFCKVCGKIHPHHEKAN